MASVSLSDCLHMTESAYTQILVCAFTRVLGTCLSTHIVCMPHFSTADSICGEERGRYTRNGETKKWIRLRAHKASGQGAYSHALDANHRALSAN